MYSLDIHMCDNGAESDASPQKLSPPRKKAQKRPPAWYDDSILESPWKLPTYYAYTISLNNNQNKMKQPTLFPFQATRSNIFKPRNLARTPGINWRGILCRYHRIFHESFSCHSF